MTYTKIACWIAAGMIMTIVPWFFPLAWPLMPNWSSWFLANALNVFAASLGASFIQAVLHDTVVSFKARAR